MDKKVLMPYKRRSACETETSSRLSATAASPASFRLQVCAIGRHTTTSCGITYMQLKHASNGCSCGARNQKSGTSHWCDVMHADSLYWHWHWHWHWRSGRLWLRLEEEVSCSPAILVYLADDHASNDSSTLQHDRVRDITENNVVTHSLEGDFLCLVIDCPVSFRLREKSHTDVKDFVAEIRMRKLAHVALQAVDAEFLGQGIGYRRVLAVVADTTDETTDRPRGND